MRLSNEVDQNFVRAAVPDGAAELLTFLPSLGTAESMVFGEAVNLPMRVLLNNLPEEYRPHSSSASFTDLWSEDRSTPQLMENVYTNWKRRSHGYEAKSDADAEIAQSTPPTPQPTKPELTLAQRVAAAPSLQRRATDNPDLPKRRATDFGGERRSPSPPTQQKSKLSILKSNGEISGRTLQSGDEVKKLLNAAFNRDN